MALQANSTFLPILDDLLSPEFRPVLQTPTSCATTPKNSGSGMPSNFNSTYINGNEIPSNSSKGVKGPNRSQSVPSQLVTHVSNDAACKIQNWWRKRSIGENSTVDLRAERAKHSIRHTRTEAHVQHLESEVNRLKTALSAERKLRSLQLEAIRSLWSQVQRISTPGTAITKPDGVGIVGIMSQSMPNGLPISNSPRKKAQLRDGMSMSYAGEIPSEDNGYHINAQVGCTSACVKEIENLKETLSSEISQLREMIAKLRTPEQISDIGASKSTTITSDSPENKESRHEHAQRPASLNIGNRGNQSQSENTELLSELPEAEEIVDYASQMASKLLEDAVEGEDKEKQEIDSRDLTRI